MIVLDNAGTRALSLINTQNGANVEVCFSDYTTSSGAYARGVPTLTTISSATTTSICATPASGVIRDVDYVNIYNTYAGSQNFTVQITSGSGGPFVLVFATLAQNESLNYTHGSGWCAMDANGNRKEATSTVLPSLSVTGNATIGGTLGVTGVATFTAQPILSSLTASQAVFTDGSKGLVSNAITGSGNVVMSTSPTFATSVIGGSTMAVFNSASTTVNAFGAATTLNIGNSGGTNTILGATTFSQALTASSTIASGVGTFTKATAGDAIIFTNGGASNKTGYLYTDNQYVGIFTAANGVGGANGIYFDVLNSITYIQVNGVPQAGKFTSTGLNATVIGATTPAAATVTTLNASGAINSTLNGAGFTQTVASGQNALVQLTDGTKVFRMWHTTGDALQFGTVSAHSWDLTYNGNTIGTVNSGSFDVTGTLSATGIGGIGAATSSTTNLNLAAGTTGVSSIRLPHGSAPSAPVDGDMWTTTAGLYVRINGVTVGPLS